MRRLVLALAAIAVLTVSAVAEDVWFMNGVYKVDVPSGWRYEESKRFTHVSLYAEDQKTMYITVGAPNLEVDENDFRRFAGLEMAMFFKALGSGKILHEVTDDINGFPASYFFYSVTMADGVDLSGFGAIVYYDGASVSFLGLCRPEELEQFVPILGKIVDSHETNFEAVRENLDLVLSTSRTMLKEIEAEFGDWKK